mmetsp:Transcript_3173/g.7022  ORF Transcript_3173/g.7022 Transcript_3173/m.7022 type:complete len:427 (+) Transcript_3173:141-1421(+)|eukprot:CAMPEP_0172322068 /NCGR_PEP_ID=MMETSP1058-20130122/44954_1 /TAXON_ID=83371 /ORGANISM="Detonula confervacea, Strain CCMP 353" /LENGTH=426 /DNA_ID=CAMNT_0013037711 /DNA_START=93 /DNA_END=1373 /DNA_ORIENTATION=+
MIATKLTSRGCLLHRGLARISIQSTAYAPKIKIIGNASPSPTIHIRRYAAKDSTIAKGNATVTSANIASAATTTGSAATAASNEGGMAGKLFFSSLCLATFGLGVWQTRRYFGKVEMVQKREDDLKLHPLAGFDDWQTLKNNNVTLDGKKSYRRVHLRGKFQHENQILIGPRGPPPGALAESGPNSGRGGGGGMSSSAQGYWVITPFVIFDGEREDCTPTTATSSEVEDVKPKRGWFGRLKGKTSKPDNSNDTASNLEAVNDEQSSDTNKEQSIIWIKRGWIPRQYINKNNEVITPWAQPQGIVQLLAMESNTDTPGTFTPPSRIETIKKQPTTKNTVPTLNKLLWMDRQAMEEMTSCPNECHPPLFVEINTNANKEVPQFPVKSTQEFVGEFTVTPEIHAGYAVTWFGLSGAGMVMTRKLLTRGR